MRDENVLDAARQLVAQPNQYKYVEEVISVSLRDVDSYEDNPSVVTFLPIGPVIGIVTHRHNMPYEDKDIVFVATKAFLQVVALTGCKVEWNAARLIMPEEGKPDAS